MLIKLIYSTFSYSVDSVKIFYREFIHYCVTMEMIEILYTLYWSFYRFYSSGKRNRIDIVLSINEESQDQEIFKRDIK